jgi:hypothetical protein
MDLLIKYRQDGEQAAAAGAERVAASVNRIQVAAAKVGGAQSGFQSLAQAMMQYHRLDAQPAAAAAMKGMKDELSGLGGFFQNNLLGPMQGWLLGLAGFGTALAALREAIRAPAEVGRSAQQLGVSAAFFQDLERAANLSGSGIGTATALLYRLQMSLADAQGGNEKTAASFRKLGVDISKVTDAEEAAILIFKYAAEHPMKGAEAEALREVGGRTALKTLPLMRRFGGAEALKMDFTEQEAMEAMLREGAEAEAKGMLKTVAWKIMNAFPGSLAWLYSKYADVLFQAETGTTIEAEAARLVKEAEERRKEKPVITPPEKKKKAEMPALLPALAPVASDELARMGLFVGGAAHSMATVARATDDLTRTMQDVRLQIRSLQGQLSQISKAIGFAGDTVME